MDVRKALLKAKDGNGTHSEMSPDLFSSIIEVQSSGIDLDFLVSCVVVRSGHGCELVCLPRFTKCDILLRPQCVLVENFCSLARLTPQFWCYNECAPRSPQLHW